MKKAIITLSILCGGLIVLNPLNNTSFAENSNNNKININTSTVEVIKQLKQEQAEDLLKMRNPNIKYIYQGDENTFEFLKGKGLGGYVFLPDVDGDMAYFVEKNTTNIYYFHPSGYLDLIV